MIVSKHPSSAPWQMAVTSLPLALLLVITKYSNGCSSRVEYSQKVLEVVHCGGMAMARGQGGNGACNGNVKGNGAMGQRRLIVPIAINQSCGCGAPTGSNFIPFFI
jgi:hypothetical protein